MTTLNKTPGAILLETGEIFLGQLFSVVSTPQTIKGSAPDFKGYGEVVFNTSMVGYQEVLTDPSYYGQMICMTYPHIGNTGINFEDIESKKIWCSGFIIHDLSEDPSSWRSKNDLNSYLKSAGIPAITGVDTRALTKSLRTRGVSRGVIVSLSEGQSQKQIEEAKKLFKELPSFEGRDLIKEVSTREPYLLNALKSQKKSFRVVAMDFGIKTNLIRLLNEFGCEVEVVPATTTAEQILNKKPDGVFLSNGPGDPMGAPYATKTIQGLLGKLPIFGVCMGHQLLALALGGKTFKLKFGHRGGNQPVLDQGTGKVEISSHNHGYAVDDQSLPKEVKVTHRNLNDQTVEGLEAASLNAFSVQYHPEASPGPHDSIPLFHKFVEMMVKNS